MWWIYLSVRTVGPYSITQKHWQVIVFSGVSGPTSTPYGKGKVTKQRREKSVEDAQGTRKCPVCWILSTAFIIAAP
jgi:hypothetical protein